MSEQSREKMKLSWEKRKAIPGFKSNFKGKKHSEETKKIMRIGKIGRIITPEWRANLSKARKGKKFTEEHKKNLSIANKGKVSWAKGKKFSPEHRKKIGLAKDRGLTPLHIRIRTSLEYKLWRKSVFERDDYTCPWRGNLRQTNIKAFR